MFTEKLKIQEGSEYLPSVIAGLMSSIPGFAEFCENKISECRADINALRYNPGSTCRRKFEKHIKMHPMKYYDTLDEFYNANPSLQESLNLNIDLNSWVDVGGKTVEIDNNDEAYAALYEQLYEKRYAYRGIQIIDKGDKLKVYFL
jgi:hypothetical protein